MFNNELILDKYEFVKGQKFDLIITGENEPEGWKINLGTYLVTDVQVLPHDKLKCKYIVERVKD